MHRFQQHRSWNLILALCLCVGALSYASISRAEGDGGDDDCLRNNDPPSPIGAGDPDIPQNRSGNKPGAGTGRIGAGIYRSNVPVVGVESNSKVWMIRFHAAARMWAAYFVRR